LCNPDEVDEKGESRHRSRDSPRRANDHYQNQMKEDRSSATIPSATSSFQNNISKEGAMPLVPSSSDHEVKAFAWKAYRRGKKWKKR
jgi:hypothetical protein